MTELRQAHTGMLARNILVAIVDPYGDLSPQIRLSEPDEIWIVNSGREGDSALRENMDRLQAFWQVRIHENTHSYQETGKEKYRAFKRGVLFKTHYLETDRWSIQQKWVDFLEQLRTMYHSDATFYIPLPEQTPVGYVVGTMLQSLRMNIKSFNIDTSYDIRQDPRAFQPSKRRDETATEITLLSDIRNALLLMSNSPMAKRTLIAAIDFVDGDTNEEFRSFKLRKELGVKASTMTQRTGKLVLAKCLRDGAANGRFFVTPTGIHVARFLELEHHQHEEEE